MQCSQTKELCSDQIDNDNDGARDCADADCFETVSCKDGWTKELCTNTKDDDGDGLKDCSDPDCSTASACKSGGSTTDAKITINTPLIYIAKNMGTLEQATAWWKYFAKFTVSDTDWLVNISGTAKVKLGNVAFSVGQNRVLTSSIAEQNTGTYALLVNEQGLSNIKSSIVPGKKELFELVVTATDSVGSKTSATFLIDVVAEQTAVQEDCDNGVDDNADKAIDCGDQSCVQAQTCQNSKGPGPENCSNGSDDNANGAIDCADLMCTENSSCEDSKIEEDIWGGGGGSWEICGNYADDDNDTLADCDDTDCKGSAFCFKEWDEICDNKKDDNANSLIDCADTFCVNTAICKNNTGKTGEVCANGKDDDGDNFIDCNDSECNQDLACTGQGNTGQLQQYPEISLEATVDKQTSVGGDEVVREVMYEFKTYSTEYPGATLDLHAALPEDFEFISRSEEHDGEGSLEDVEDDDDQVIFTITIDTDDAPSSKTNTTKTYKGTLTFETAIGTKADEGANTLSVEALCYALDDNGKQPTGPKSCTTAWVSSAVKADSAKATIYLEDDGTVSDDQRGKNDLDDDSSSCRESGQEKNNCSDGKDNDCDGKKDCNDSDCSSASSCKNYNAADDCGDGTIDPNEMCDDGNDDNNDGCSSSCKIEEGWTCPAGKTCEIMDCHIHGETFGGEMSGFCCGGLVKYKIEDVINDDDSFTSYYLCYNPQIDEPVCLPNASPEWRYLKQEANKRAVHVLDDTCEARLQDFSEAVKEFRNTSQSFCAYSDLPYDRVNFRDIVTNRERSSILALQHYCIVSGHGRSLQQFQPNRRVSRAEFIKMLVKILYMDEGIAGGSGSVLPGEGTAYQWETTFVDIPASHRAASYIQLAYEEGLLDPVLDKNLLKSFFQPNRSITKKEMIAILSIAEWGQRLTESTMAEMLWKETYPTRAKTATLLVRKFLPQFREYLYIQGDNGEYYAYLENVLFGKRYRDQYEILVDQLKKLEDIDADSKRAKKDIFPFRIQSFIKALLNGQYGNDDDSL